MRIPHPLIRPRILENINNTDEGHVNPHSSFQPERRCLPPRIPPQHSYPEKQDLFLSTRMFANK